MVTLYTSPSCTSCRKAKAWLEEHDIAFTERNIFSEPLSLEEIKEILRMTEDGTDEIISTRSKVFQKLDVDIDLLPLKDLFQLIQINTGLLRRPIILDEKIGRASCRERMQMQEYVNSLQKSTKK